MEPEPNIAERQAVGLWQEVQALAKLHERVLKEQANLLKEAAYDLKQIIERLEKTYGQ